MARTQGDSPGPQKCAKLQWQLSTPWTQSLGLGTQNEVLQCPGRWSSLPWHPMRKMCRSPNKRSPIMAIFPSREILFSNLHLTFNFLRLCYFGFLFQKLSLSMEDFASTHYSCAWSKQAIESKSKIQTPAHSLLIWTGLSSCLVTMRCNFIQPQFSPLYVRKQKQSYGLGIRIGIMELRSKRLKRYSLCLLLLNNPETLSRTTHSHLLAKQKYKIK